MNGPSLFPSVCFVVEKIIGVSSGDGNMKNYQVQWAPTWVSSSNLVGCQHLIEEFNSQQTSNDNTSLDSMGGEDSSSVLKNSCQNTGLINVCSDTIEESSQKSVPTNPEPLIAEDHCEDVNSGQISPQEASISDNYSHSYKQVVKIEDEMEGAEMQHSLDSYNSVSVTMCSIEGKLNFVEEEIQCKLSHSKSIPECEIDLNEGSLEQSSGGSSFVNIYVCSFCSEHFSSKCDLDVHMSVAQHIPFTKSRKKFVCPECGKDRFSSKRALDRHVQNHSSLQRFVCECCEKSFTRKHDLERHTLCHSNQKLFKCTLCDKQFNRKQNLEKHIVTH